MSIVSSVVYEAAANQVLAKMEELKGDPDRWEKLKKWVDEDLRSDE